MHFYSQGKVHNLFGMGKDLYEKYSEIKEIYEKVSEITKMPIKEVSFEGPEEELFQTKNTQIAILTMSLGILEVLKKNQIEANVSAGLSLGEYSALIYSKYISFEDGVEIVKKRGKLMQENVPEGEWKMAGIIGLDDETVEKLCEEIENGFVVPANYNTPRAGCYIRRKKSS